MGRKEQPSPMRSTGSGPTIKVHNPMMLAEEDEEEEPTTERPQSAGLILAERNGSSGSVTAFASVDSELSNGDAGSEEDNVAWGDLAAYTALREGRIDAFVVSWCRNACASRWLDTTVMVAILVSTCTLAWENPANTLSAATRSLLVALDAALTVIFTAEMAVRILAMGWWDRKGRGHAPNVVYEPRYMNDPWNKLDFLVVVSSLLNVAVELAQLSLPFSMSTLRALRILRVLKALKRGQGVRQILSTIAQAMPYSLNVLGFLGFMFLVCGIIAVQMFRGSGRHRCEYASFQLQAHLDPDKFPLTNTTNGNISGIISTTVQGNSHPWPQPPPVRRPAYEYPVGLGMWVTYCSRNEDCPLYDVAGPWNRTQVCQPSLNPGRGFHSFDSVVDAWLALFINMVMLYWWETAYRIEDANIGMGSSIAWAFGAFNVFILTYVTANMFVAVITTIFMDVRSQEEQRGAFGDKRETLEQKQARLDEELERRRKAWSPPAYFVVALGGDGPFGDRTQGLIWHQNFDRLILAFIFINTFALACERHDTEACDDPDTAVVEMQSPDNALCQFQWFVDVNMFANFVFNFVFTTEAIMKICGMGFQQYIWDAFNALDFFIVVTSALDMLGDITSSGDEASSFAVFKTFRVLRLFRVLRVARILYKNKNLKRVLQTVFGSGVAIANLIMFIFFSVLVFSIVGMHLTAGLYTPDNNVELAYGDNSATLWGRLTGDGAYVTQQDTDGNTRYGYDVTEFIRKGLIPRRNFEDFPRAFLLSFQVMTGDDWVNQMHDVMEVKGGIIPALLFTANFSFCNFILLSLFIAVILENFEVAEAEKLELQKQRFEEIEISEKTRAQRPKITFIHRLVWLCGGEGGRGFGTLSMSEEHLLDVEGIYGPRDSSGQPLEFGTLMPGTKWYNDERSLFSFGPDASIRQAAMRFVENKYFDKVVLTAIATGTMILALEGPPGSLAIRGTDAVFGAQTQRWFDTINHGLFGIYMIEFVAKTVASGFAFTPEAYLKDPWNKLDFFVLMGTILSYAGISAGFVKVLRCLRPLRIINRNAGMRVIITAVVNSLTVNLGVLALSGVGLLMFAILGVSMFAGQFWQCTCSHVFPEGVTPLNAVFDSSGGYRMLGTDRVVGGPGRGVSAPTCSSCRGTNANVPNMSACPTVCFAELQQHCVGINGTGGIYGVDPAYPDTISQCYWDNRPYNFDTVPNAAMALFTASTLAGWTDIMEIGLDVAGIGYQPIPFGNYWTLKVVYFLIYIIVMSFFVTNLFVGVLIDFIGSSDGSSLLTEAQKQAQDMQKFKRLHRPTVAEEAPAQYIRNWLYGLVESTTWEFVSSGFIIFNVVVMMCEHEDQSEAWWNTLELLNYICLIFFTVEMAFKLLAYFPMRYARDPWNKFDATVIILSWLALIFDLTGAAAIRALRALRMVLVLKSAKGMQALFRTLVLSVSPASNVCILLLLLYALYALLGMLMFGNMPIQDVACTDETGISAGPRYCTWMDPGPIGSWFSGVARGKQGQVLGGLNRQYTHHASFRDFFSAMRLLLQCSAGQDWKFVMYAVGGEPGQPEGMPVGSFLYFMSFLFFSNYVMLNLFIVVILDTFSALMREGELHISEQEFERFKYIFREFTTDREPEKLMFRKLWPLLVWIGSEATTDEHGNSVEMVLSPPVIVEFRSAERKAFRRTRGDSSSKYVSNLVEFLTRFYHEEGSFRPSERVGITFNSWYSALMETPACFESADVDTSPGARSRTGARISSSMVTQVAPEAAEWEQYRLSVTLAADMSSAKERRVTYDVLQWAINTLRFRMRYHKLIAELRFHGTIYINPSSSILYNDLLQALVNMKLGEASFDLQEHMLRSAMQNENATGGRYREAHWVQLLDENQAYLEQQIAAASLDSSVTADVVKQLQDDLASILQAKEEIRIFRERQEHGIRNHSSKVCTQFLGKGKFVDTYLELDDYELIWRKNDTDTDITRKADLRSCVFSPPRNIRKGFPHAFRIDLKVPDSCGDLKHIVAPPTNSEMSAWLEALKSVSGTRWVDETEAATPSRGRRGSLNSSVAVPAGKDLDEVGEVVLAGYLNKTKLGKKLQRRWCTLISGDAGPMLAYRKTEEGSCLGILALQGTWVTTAGTTFCFTPCRQNNIAKRSTLFEFDAGSADHLGQWLVALSRTGGVNLPPLDDLCSVEYDALAASASDLTDHLCAIANDLGIARWLSKSEQDIRNYCQEIQRLMHPQNPFHNYHHCADVTQMLYYLLRSTGVAALLDPLQLLGLWLAAPAHDLDHRGRTIAFERASRSEVGLRYAEEPLEAHHAQLALQLVERLGLLDALPTESQTLVQQFVEASIMATDMAQHTAIIERFRESEAELLWGSRTAADFFGTYSSKSQLLLSLLLKASDISNPSRPLPTARRWNARCYEEFHAEGRASQSAGRAVLPLHDPKGADEASIARASVTFIDFAVRPVFEELHKFLQAAALGADAPGLRPAPIEAILNSLQSNRAHHSAAAAAGARAD